VAALTRIYTWHMSTKRTLTPPQKKALIVLATIEFTAKLFALRDLQRRPDEQVRGSKRLWRMAMVINFFGPASYFVFGRRDATSG
jgi:hypothetical protein